MITLLTDVPPGVTGFEASGKLQTEDDRDLLLPAIEDTAKTGDARVVIVITDFDGLSGGALWQDLKMGVEKRITSCHGTRTAPPNATTSSCPATTTARSCTHAAGPSPSTATP